MRYYYVHGFNSGKNSSTGLRLREALNEEVISLSYDSAKSFDENYRSLLEQVSETEDFCVIGTSLGAFYANFVASFYGMPCVLFNPVIDIMKESDITSIPRMIFVTTDKAKEIQNIYGNYAEIEIVEKIDNDFTYFVDKIKETANTFCV